MAADEPKAADDAYPVDGLTSVELRQMFEQAQTNLPPDIRVAFVWVKKGKQAVVRILVPDPKKNDRAEDVRLRLSAPSFGASPLWLVTERVRAEPAFHTAGIPLTDVVSLLQAFPVGPAILSLSVTSEARVTVMTGTVAAPLAGSGLMFRYEKKDGKWEKVTESAWKS